MTQLYYSLAYAKGLHHPSSQILANSAMFTLLYSQYLGNGNNLAVLN